MKKMKKMKYKERGKKITKMINRLRCGGLVYHLKTINTFLCCFILNSNEKRKEWFKVDRSCLIAHRVWRKNTVELLNLWQTLTVFFFFNSVMFWSPMWFYQKDIFILRVPSKLFVLRTGFVLPKRKQKDSRSHFIFSFILPVHYFTWYEILVLDGLSGLNVIQTHNNT